jgi:hypothetical protein
LFVGFFIAVSPWRLAADDKIVLGSVGRDATIPNGAPSRMASNTDENRRGVNKIVDNFDGAKEGCRREQRRPWTSTRHGRFHGGILVSRRRCGSGNRHGAFRAVTEIG